MAASPPSLSLVIDPVTRDLVDTPDGWFLEGTDSRTEVLWQLEATFRGWFGDPPSGSNLRALLQPSSAPNTTEDPPDIQAIRDEALRALQPLVAEGIITDLTATTDVDETGRNVVVLNYRDRSSGTLVDLAYVPFGG